MKYHLSPLQLKQIQEREQATLQPKEETKKGDKKAAKKIEVKEVAIEDSAEEEENKFERPKTCIDILCQNLEEPWINI